MTHLLAAPLIVRALTGEALETAIQNATMNVNFVLVWERRAA
jgi:hypothetical protein